MFFFLIGFCVVQCCGDFFRCCLKRCDMVQDTDEIEVDEQLGNYFETLPNHSRKNWLATEVSNSQRLGIKTMGVGTYEQLRTTQGKTKVMKNTINYNILANPIYMVAFQYVPMTQRDNIEESTTSEMVTAALYAAQKKEGFTTGNTFAGAKPRPKGQSMFHKKMAVQAVATAEAVQQQDFGTYPAMN